MPQPPEPDLTEAGAALFEAVTLLLERALDLVAGADRARHVDELVATTTALAALVVALDGLQRRGPRID